MDVPEWMKAALLRRCVMENSNAATKSILVTLPSDATIEAMLERMSRVPVGPQAFLVEAVRELGKDLVQAQSQVFAALAPLNPPRETGRKGSQGGKGMKCFRCGKEGHMRHECKAKVWCQNCNLGTHDTPVCRASGNAQWSARSRRAPTTVATPMQYSNPTLPAHHETAPPPTIPTPAPPAMQPAYSQTPPDHNNYNQPQGRASDWIWKLQ